MHNGTVLGGGGSKQWFKGSKEWYLGGGGSNKWWLGGGSYDALVTNISIIINLSGIWGGAV